MNGHSASHRPPVSSERSTDTQCSVIAEACTLPSWFLSIPAGDGLVHGRSSIDLEAECASRKRTRKNADLSRAVQVLERGHPTSVWRVSSDTEFAGARQCFFVVARHRDGNGNCSPTEHFIRRICDDSRLAPRPRG